MPIVPRLLPTGGPYRPAADGFTTLELLVVTALLCWLLLIALPAGSDWLRRHRLQHAAQSVLSDLQLARSEAAQSSRNIIFRVMQSAAGTCYVVHAGPSNGCTCNLSGPPSCSGDAQPIRQAQWPRRAGYPNLLSNVPMMLFSGRQGTTSLAATLQVQSDGVGEIRHVISITGRVRSCSLDRALTRWPRCEGTGS